MLIQGQSPVHDRLCHRLAPQSQDSASPVGRGSLYALGAFFVNGNECGNPLKKMALWYNSGTVWFQTSREFLLKTSGRHLLKTSSKFLFKRSEIPFQQVMQTPQPCWCQLHRVSEERLTSRVRKWNWEESGLSFGMHSSCRMDFQTWSFFINCISMETKTDSTPTWGCCWVVQEYVYVICSLQQQTDHFTCSPGACWRTNRVKQKQAVPWSPSWQHAWGNQSSPSKNRWSDEPRPMHPNHGGPSTAGLTTRWRVTWV